MDGLFFKASIYGPVYFRMRRSLLNMIIERVCTRDHYFVQRRDAIWNIKVIIKTKDHRCIVDASFGDLCRCNGQIL